MLKFEFTNPIHSHLSFVVTFYIKEKDDYREIAKFHFDSQAFDSFETALSIFAGLAGNNFMVNASFGYMFIQTDKVVCYDNILDVICYAEVKKPGDDPFDEYLKVDFYYSDSMSVDKVYQLINENLGIESFGQNVEQLSDF